MKHRKVDQSPGKELIFLPAKFKELEFNKFAIHYQQDAIIYTAGFQITSFCYHVDVKIKIDYCV